MRGISRFKITFESLFQHLHPTASISHYNPQSFIFLPLFSIVFLRWHHLFLPLSFCRPSTLPCPADVNNMTKVNVFELKLDSNGLPLTAGKVSHLLRSISNRN